MKGTLRFEVVEYPLAISQRMLKLVPALSEHAELSALVHSRSISTTNITGSADTRRTLVERITGMKLLPESFVLVTMPEDPKDPAALGDFDRVVSNIRQFSVNELFRAGVAAF